MDISRYQDPDAIRAALSERAIAVVGLSANPARDSHEVAQYLQQAGYRIIPVNPNVDEVLGEPAVDSLADLPAPAGLVDVFRDPDAVPDIARAAVAAGAKYLWLQLGVISEEGAAIAEAGGVTVIMDRCTKVEHARYRRELPDFRVDG